MNYSAEASDSVVKNELFFKIKTDLTPASSNNATINPANEIYNFTRVIRPIEIWKDNPLSFSTPFTQIAMFDINANITNLQKRAWKLPNINCPVVPYSYGNVFVPIFQYSTNYFNVNNITTPYRFDYYTGVLTFLSNLPPFATNDLVYCSGFRYTGTDLTTISGLMFSPNNNNIGISSSVPSQKLDVNGNIYVSSNILANSNITANCNISVINGNYFVGSTVIVDNFRNFSNVTNLYSTGNITGNIATLSQPFVTTMPVLTTIGNAVFGNVGIGSSSQFLNLNGGNIVVNTNGSLGISIVPAAANKLDVNGNINTNTNITATANITGTGNIITSGNYYSSTLIVIDNNRNVGNVGNINAGGNINATGYLIGTVFTPTQGNIVSLPVANSIGTGISGTINMGTTGQSIVLTGNIVNISGGNLGVANASPIHRVDVTGNINASGNILVGNTVVINSTRNIGNVGNVLATGNLQGNIITVLQPFITTMPLLNTVGNNVTGNVTIGPTTNLSVLNLTGNTICAYGGNVGIATVSPIFQLDVYGDINASRNYYVDSVPVITSSRNIINIGNITTNGNITGSIITPSQPFITSVGSSATGNVTIGSGSKILNLTGNTICAYGGNVGIATVSPIFQLDVYGDINASRDYYVDSVPVITSSRNIINIGNISTNGNITGNIITVSQPFITTMPLLNTVGNAVTGNITIGNNSSITNIIGANIVFSSTGNVGIATISPNFRLDVAGDVNATGNYYVGSTIVINSTRNIGNVGNVLATGNLQGNIITVSQPFITTMPLLNTIGSSANSTVTVGATNRSLVLQSTDITINTAGNVGIGTTDFTTLQKLHVAGNVNCVNYFINNTRVIDNNRNIILGIGNITTTGTIGGTLTTPTQNNVSTMTGLSTIGTVLNNGISIGTTGYGITLTANNVNTTGTLSINKATVTGSHTLDVNGTINATGIFIGGTAVSAIPNIGSVTGTLGVGNGGTGTNSFTSGQIIYGNSSSPLSSSGNFTFDGNNISLGSATGQKINMFGSSYGIGIQNSTLYHRTASDYQFYKAGSHSDTQGASGSGGSPLMCILGTGNVGIGRSTAAYALDVNGIISGTDIRIGATSINPSGVYLPLTGGTLTGSLTLNSTNGITVGGSITPSFGTGTNGIIWGIQTTSDQAWIKYYYNTGEQGIFEFGIGNDTNDNIYFNVTGNVGIGYNTPDYKLKVNGGIYAAGDIIATGDVTAAFSDERLKDIIEPNIPNALNKVLSLNGFKYKSNQLAKDNGYPDDKEQIGLSAQQVKEILPEIVKIAAFDYDPINKCSKSGNDYLTIDYSRMVPLLVEAIKEQNNTIIELKEHLVVLNAKLELLVK